MDHTIEECSRTNFSKVAKQITAFQQNISAIVENGILGTGESDIEMQVCGGEWGNVKGKREKIHTYHKNKTRQHTYTQSHIHIHTYTFYIYTYTYTVEHTYQE